MCTQKYATGSKKLLSMPQFVVALLTNDPDPEHADIHIFSKLTGFHIGHLHTTLTSEIQK